MINTLFSNKWVSVMEKTIGLDGHEIKWVYSHSEWCNGIGVAILPYSERTIGDHIERQYLGRYELCLAHSDTPELSCIMGGYDNSDTLSLEGCILNELKEEAGYIANAWDLKYLGKVRPDKASSCIMNIYAIKIDSTTERCEINGDGSIIESFARNEWLTGKQILESESSLLITMYAKLNETL